MKNLKKINKTRLKAERNDLRKASVKHKTL